MKGYSEQFVTSLKGFKKYRREPPEAATKAESVNVYRHTKALSMSFACSNSNQTTSSSQLLKFHSNPSQTSTLSLSTSLKLQQPSNPSLHKQLITPQKNSIFTQPKRDFSSLITLSQKESIIFNQVKSFITKQSHQGTASASQELPTLPKSQKIKINAFKKLGTMKRALYEQESISEEPNVETVQTVKVVKKRQQLKSRIWRWVGAEGSVIY